MSENVTGTEVGSIILKYGLDTSEAQRDFNRFNANMVQASNEMQTKINTAKDRVAMAKLDGKNGAIVQEMNSQLALQATAVGLANHAYQQSVALKGADAAASQKALASLTAEQRAYKELQTELKNVKKARIEAISNRAENTLTGASIAIAGAMAYSLKKAIDAVESENLFQESFGTYADKARDWSKQLSNSVGLNEYEVRKNAGNFYVMTQSMGLMRDQAFGLSKDMTQLAYDMASFYNISNEEAFIKIKSGITGEMEPLRALGILVDEDTVKRQAWKDGMVKEGQELTQQQKVLARHNAIMAQTTKAQGDLARTMDSPANQIRRMKTEMEALATEIGFKLIPTFQRLMDSTKGAKGKWEEMSDSQQDGIIQAGKFALEVVGINKGLGLLAGSMGLPLPPMAKLGIALAILTENLAEYGLELNKVKSYNEKADVFKNPFTGTLYKKQSFGFKDILEDVKTFKNNFGRLMFGDKAMGATEPLKFKTPFKLLSPDETETQSEYDKVRKEVEEELKNEGKDPKKNELELEKRIKIKLNPELQAIEDDKIRKEAIADADKQLNNEIEKIKTARKSIKEIREINDGLRETIYKNSHTELEGSVYSLSKKYMDEMRKVADITPKFDQSLLIEAAESEKNKLIFDKTKDLNEKIKDENDKLNQAKFKAEEDYQNKVKGLASSMYGDVQGKIVDAIISGKGDVNDIAAKGVEQANKRRQAQDYAEKILAGYVPQSEKDKIRKETAYTPDTKNLLDYQNQLAQLNQLQASLSQNFIPALNQFAQNLKQPKIEKTIKIDFDADIKAGEDVNEVTNRLIEKLQKSIADEKAMEGIL